MLSQSPPPPPPLLLPSQVNLTSLDLEHAYIQITHVEPFFSPTELDLRKTKFERETRISRFVFESAFTHGDVRSADVTKQCMRKTILTSKWRGSANVLRTYIRYVCNNSHYESLFLYGIIIIRLYTIFLKPIHYF